ncbi:MAG: VOC family protein [Acidimicrobiales bacterium]
MTRPANGTPVQIAYVVDDVRAAATRWAAEEGAGPFFVRDHIPVTEVVHRGHLAAFDHSSACGQWGDLMLELVVDHGDGPSAVRDMFAPGRYGLHHMALFCDDVGAEAARLEAAGHPVAQTALAWGQTRFTFVDTTATRGHMIELYEPSDRLLDFYAMVADAAAGWDGGDPVREL